MNPEPTNPERKEPEMSEVEVNERTRVPIGIAVVCTGAMVSGAIWLQVTMAGIRADMRNNKSEIAIELRDNKTELAAIRNELAHRFSRDAFEIWVLKLNAANPNIQIPELK